MLRVGSGINNSGCVTLSTPSPPQVRQAIRNSADPLLSDAERIEALQFAFFAPGNDPRGWLKGWHPEVLQAQRIAGDRTSREEDFAAGRKIGCPLLLLWGATGGVGRNHKSMEIWPRYAANIVAGKALPCGHYLSDEAPEETYRELRDFFAAGELA